MNNSDGHFGFSRGNSWHPCIHLHPSPPNITQYPPISPTKNITQYHPTSPTSCSIRMDGTLFAVKVEKPRLEFLFCRKGFKRIDYNRGIPFRTGFMLEKKFQSTKKLQIKKSASQNSSSTYIMNGFCIGDEWRRCELKSNKVVQSPEGLPNFCPVHIFILFSKYISSVFLKYIFILFSKYISFQRVPSELLGVEHDNDRGDRYCCGNERDKTQNTKHNGGKEQTRIYSR